MKNRFISAVAIIICSLLLVFLSGTIVYPVAIAVLAIIAVFELLKVIGAHKKLTLSIPAYMIAAAFPIIAFFVGVSNVLGFLLSLSASVFVYYMWLMGVGVFSKGEITFSKISEVFGAVTYISVSASALTLLRYLDSNYGVFLVALILIISWGCDAAAYGVGSFMGKHKLIPEISPKKTVEGAIGGIVITALISPVYGFIVSLIADGVSVNYLYLTIFGLVLSVVSQLGDLIASFIKREYGVKDYGNLIPGHGGIMDRFDSVFAISTILLILSIVFPPFGVA